MSGWGSGFGTSSFGGGGASTSSSTGSVFSFGSGGSTTGASGGSSASTSSGTNGSMTNSNPNNSREINERPQQFVGRLMFHANRPLLAASSWDGCLYVYEYDNDLSTRPKSRFQLQSGSEGSSGLCPVLDCCWSSDECVFAGKADGTAEMCQITGSNRRIVAKHKGPIRHVGYIKERQILVTSSWDMTSCFWDLRSESAVQTIDLKAKAHCMDVRDSVLVYGLHSGEYKAYDLRTMRVMKQAKTALKHQFRDCCIFPKLDCFAMVSVEGRTAIEYFVDTDTKKKSFSFKCHRNAKDVFAVNCVRSHPLGTFVTAGSDGSMHIWCKDTRCRLKSFSPMPNPVTAVDFSPNGQVFAYASGYDYSRGFDESRIRQGVKLFLHKIEKSDVVPAQTPKKPSRPATSSSSSGWGGW